MCCVWKRPSYFLRQNCDCVNYQRKETVLDNEKPASLSSRIHAEAACWGLIKLGNWENVHFSRHLFKCWFVCFYGCMCAYVKPAKFGHRFQFLSFFSFFCLSGISEVRSTQAFQTRWNINFIQGLGISWWLEDTFCLSQRGLWLHWSSWRKVEWNQKRQMKSRNLSNENSAQHTRYIQTDRTPKGPG